MTYNPNERVDAGKQKEVANQEPVNGAVKTFGDEARDTEFALEEGEALTAGMGTQSGASDTEFASESGATPKRNAATTGAAAGAGATTGAGAATGATADTEFAADTELASDTWTGAVFNPEVAKADGTMTYDPLTQKETYRGNATQTNASGASARNEQTQGKTAAQGNQATGAAAGKQGNKTETLTSTAGVRDNDARKAAVTQATRYETAAEIATPLRRPQTANRTTQADNRTYQKAEEPARENNPGGGLGMVGLGLSILSLFLLPYLIAPVGIILGYLAFRRGARTMGIWSMVIGAAAILGAMVFYPYYLNR